MLGDCHKPRIFRTRSFLSLENLEIGLLFSCVKEEILIHCHSGTKNSISLFLHKNPDEVPSL